MADMLSAAAKKIKSLMYEQGRYDVNLVGGVEKEVYSLADDLITLRNVLNDAENRRFKDENIDYWLSKLERASYEMEDVLDAWNYAMLELRIPDVAPLKQKVLSFAKAFTSLSFEKAASRRNIAEKILNVKALFDEILKEKDQYSFVISQAKADSWPIHIDSGELVGLDRDRDILVTKLMGNGGESGIEVVCVVGAGGVGKTTLARLVYNNSRVEQSFDLRIWVSVSGPFDLVVIAKGILESIKKGSSPNTNKINSLLDDVKESVLGKKFFLVLDGVSKEDINEWEHLENSLGCGGVGSKILVTTRNERVVEMLDLKDSEISRLGLLSDEDCWLLLSRIALSGRNKVEFEGTGKEIAKKCDGVPFVVKIMGSLLRFKNSLEEWQGVLNSEIWEIKGGVVELFPYLILYYNELSQTLRHCFLYCASFPKDSNIDVEDLIRKWMALGYLGSDSSGLEDRGRESFDILVKHSLFRDIVRDDQDEKIIRCKMHDVAHDFAQFLRKSSRVEVGTNKSTTCQACDPLFVSNVNEFCSLYCTRASPPNLCDCVVRLRVLSLHHCGLESIPQGLENLIHLRWLNLFRMGLPCESLKIIFQLYNLQTLSLTDCFIEEVPREIGNLIHLTHLNMSGNVFFSEFPSEIGKLINLSRLILSQNPYLKELPREIGNLIHLRHLEVTKNESLEELPSEIGKLIQLRHLNLSGNKSLKELPTEIGNLIHLKHLDLSSNELLEKLPSEIGNLVHLRRLILRMNSSLKELPEEIGNLIQLIHLDLSASWLLEKLPESIRCLQKLKTLKVDHCDYLWMPEALAELTGLRSLGDYGQKSLSQLRLLKNLNNLRGSLALHMNLSYPEGLVEEAQNANLRNKASIVKLKFYFEGGRDDPSSSRVGMDVLDALEPHPNLKELQIQNFNGSKLSLWMLSPLNQLIKLDISCTYCLTSLPSLGKLPCLEEFRASRLAALQFAGREFLGITTVGVGETSSYIGFPRLKILEIAGCDEWKEWEDITEEEESTAFRVMPCLTELRIEHCKALAALPLRLLGKALLLEKWNFSGSTLLEQHYSNNDVSEDDEY